MGQYIGVLILVALVALIFWARRRQRDSSWTGTVTRISDHTEDSDDGATYYKRVQYQTEQGKSETWDIPDREFRKTYSALAVGDRLTKVAGEMNPRVSKP